ncbi:HNH endonuclease [Mycolicibacterium parafortuitum]|uniref:HNH endonuclease n=1 Tax=Mycolicibacterium parafortuitum TaxID=39692 RepID=A0A7I7TW44_MYCPF|nr:HNH endonuclease signature motif containing protein [Mycolicibacterium parafortuitum]BBY73382.1 HNH endonuclease [Mycolicibacterium parafortuitum]
MFEVSVAEPESLAGLSDADLIDAARAASRAENAVCARKLAVMAELFGRRVDLAPEERLYWWVDPEAAVTAEIAAAYRITQALALHQTYRAVVLRDRLPRVGALFLAGTIGEMLVRAIITRTDLITDAALIAAVDAELAESVAGWGPLSVKATQAKIDEIVERHDPDAVRQSRDAEIGPALEFGAPTDAPGFTTIWSRVFDGDAAAGWRTLTAMAYSVCDADPRTLDQRRKDAWAALLHGITSLACRCGNTDCEAAVNPRPVPEVIVYALTDQTAKNAEQPAAAQGDRPPAELRDDPPVDVEGDEPQPVDAVDAATNEEQLEEAAPVEGAPDTEGGTAPAQPSPPAPAPRRSAPVLLPGRSGYLFGSGFLPAPFFDTMLDSARIREIIHPGAAGPEPRYTPSAALAEFVRCRDLTCRFPGCDKPATTADIDHTVPHPVGPTHPSNLKTLCRFHHLLKTFWTGPGGWKDRQHPDGTIVWTSPTGHTYTTHPGSRLLFPALCTPTGTLWTGDPPHVPMSDNREAMMPRRTRTRAQSRTAYITRERQHNADHHGDTPRGNDPPPF